MLVPRAAAVRPRVEILGEGTYLLSDAVAERLERGTRGWILLSGATGAGKTTALAHLAHSFAEESRLLLLDGSPSEDRELRKQQLLICTAAGKQVPDESWRLVPWSRDDVIEYLLSKYPERCAGVITRLDSFGRQLAGAPQLWSAVLDELASDDDLPDIRTALRSRLDWALDLTLSRSLAKRDCLEALCNPAAEYQIYRAWTSGARIDETALRLLMHEPTRLLAAADALASQLQLGQIWDERLGRFPHALVEETARLVSRNERAIATLVGIVQGGPLPWQPMAMSLLHASGHTHWPTRSQCLDLSGAYLSGIRWPKLTANRIQMGNADFVGADLSESDLNGAAATGADFSECNLHGARLTGMQAGEARFVRTDLTFARAAKANFRGADLRYARLDGALLAQANLNRADLSGASLVRARLDYAHLLDIQLEGADFSFSDLSGADLRGLSLKGAKFAGVQFDEACLYKCDLEGVTLPGASFVGTDLSEALLTGTRIVSGNFYKADLRGAGLADIEWEGADLRDANLRNATFLLGSTRSGLLDSPLASEGTRTGFYTDDFDEQGFKAPEEIRKANLRGADLRGALVEKTDFYLVDLRDAQYTIEQEAHFRSCGAILETRV